MNLLVTGTPRFTHYCTIAPEILKLCNAHEYVKIMTPGLRKCGADCAAQIFAQVNSIPVVTGSIEFLLDNADCGLIFYDNVDLEVGALIEVMERADKEVWVHEVEFKKAPWYEAYKGKRYKKKKVKKKTNQLSWWDEQL